MNNTRVVYVQTRTHLAVHAIGHATMAGYGVAKVLDLEPALETRSKEAAEGRYDGRKHRQHHCMQLQAHMHTHRFIPAEFIFRATLPS